MTILLQKSASIQKRTSPLKFDHFRYPKPDFTASDLSTKVSPASEKRKSTAGRSPESEKRKTRSPEVPSGEAED